MSVALARCGAALHQVQLDRTYLASDLISYSIFQNLCGTGDIAVAEGIDSGALYFFGNVATVFALHTFADSDDHGILFFQFCFHIFQECVNAEWYFAEIDKVRSFRTICTGEAGSCSQPSGVTAHHFYDCYGLGCVYVAVTFQFGKCGSDIFCCRSKT